MSLSEKKIHIKLEAPEDPNLKISAKNLIGIENYSQNDLGTFQLVRTVYIKFFLNEIMMLSKDSNAKKI